MACRRAQGERKSWWAARFKRHNKYIRLYLTVAYSLLLSDAVYACSKHWYVIYSKARKEHQAQFQLARKGIDSFFPRLRLPASNEGLRRIVPLFPNYLFVRLNLETEFLHVVWTPGVKQFVSFSDAPLPLEENIIRFLRENADREGVIPARSQLQRGQAVEIAEGPFSGLAAIIQDPPDPKGRVKVLLKLMSRNITVKIGVESVKGGGAACALPMRGNIGLSSFGALPQ